MYTVYHLNSANEINNDVIDSIKAAFKSRPITIIVQEDQGGELAPEIKKVLDERLNEDATGFIAAEESISQLKKKYDV